MANGVSGFGQTGIDGMFDYIPTVTGTDSASRKGSTDLGKDAFLQLLVCQMQNQDPMEPNNDTEYVAQLAQFSQLEQLQNLSSESQKSQAFSLIGKYCIFQSKDPYGNINYYEGKISSVNISGGRITLSTDTQTFKYEELYSVIDDTVLYEETEDTGEE
ncbi:MAG: hypothetical protein IKP88_00300 [Lachnospiraceae bacterium]|nr:hypothetical protein [Lachnospiraceae bacterium]